MKIRLLLIPLIAVLLCGCADLNTNAFRSEKLLADTTESSVHLFNVYYVTATNGASADKIAALNKDRDLVYEASRKTSAVLGVVEAARLQYSTNQTPANQQALQSSLSSLGANSGNVTGIVSNVLAPFSTLTK